MLVYNLPQGTQEWLDIRKGKFTASTFKNLFMKSSTATYKKEIYRVAYERITGESPEETYINDAMLRGKEMESEAREWYEKKYNELVQEVGFVEKNEWVGVSPDGIVKDGLIEIKCPLYNTQIEYLLDGKLPSEYKYQVHGQLWVCEKEWCDFVSYHPKLDKLVLRINRDEKIIKELETRINEAVEEVQEIINKLKKVAQ
jgi:putative phage-type endonuclease